jgi:tetratricopeptide (TPR) repeat protein
MRNAQLAAGELDSIPANLRRALAIADKLDDDLWRSRITVALGHYHWVTRDLSQAFHLGQRALDLAGRVVEALAAAQARFILGEVHWARGEYEAAVALFRKNLGIVPSEVPRGLGEGPAIVSVVNRRWLAHSLAELGSFEAAIAEAREALHTAETKDHPYSLVNALTALGMVMLRSGSFVQAVGLLERDAEICRAFGFRDMLNTCLPVLAAAYGYAGRQADACAIVDASREGQVRSSARMARLGEAALAAGALPQARAHAEVALALSREQTAGGDEAWSLYLLGAIDAREEPVPVTASEGHYRLGLVRAEALGMRPLIAHCHLGLGKLYRRTGKRQEAQEHLSIATTMYREMEMQYWLEQAEQELRELA